MKLGNYALAIISMLIVCATMWVGVPAVSLMLGQRPPWHELRVASIGWLVGTPFGVAIAQGIRRTWGKRRT